MYSRPILCTISESDVRIAFTVERRPLHVCRLRVSVIHTWITEAPAPLPAAIEACRYSIIAPRATSSLVKASIYRHIHGLSCEAVVVVMFKHGLDIELSLGLLPTLLFPHSAFHPPFRIHFHIFRFRILLSAFRIPHFTNDPLLAMIVPMSPNLYRPLW